MASLPTPRSVLTSLLNSITSAPVVSQQDTNEEPQSESTPLHLLSPSYRPLLTTLHVLFPTLVLPALDILDRSLVTRILPQDPVPLNEVKEPGPGPGTQETAASSSPEAATPPGREPSPSAQKTPKTAFYLVRSAASSTSRRTAAQYSASAAGSATSTSTPYLVRLDVWSCSCANFAFDAFPAAAAATTTARDEILPAGADVDALWPEDDGEWQFGGMSLDGRDTTSGEDGPGGVPCCKHLLACLLVERWAPAMERYVVERRVGREEMAGLVVDT